MDFRTEQYREQLAMEAKFTKRALDHLKAQNPEGAEATGNLVNLVPQEGVDKPFLFDLVFDSAALTKDGASKVHRCGLRLHMHHLRMIPAIAEPDVWHDASGCCCLCASNG